MSKAVLISIRPKWCALIANGEKTMEVRKTRPKLDTPFKCYIYETRGFERVGNDNLNCIVGRNGRGAVIGEFICDRMELYLHGQNFNDEKICISLRVAARLTTEEVRQYSGGKPLFGWHISALQIYDSPKELREITKCRYEYCKGWCGSALGVLCSYQRTLFFSDKHPKVDLNIVKCAKPDKRAPRSWCYVEEL